MKKTNLGGRYVYYRSYKGKLRKFDYCSGVSRQLRVGNNNYVFHAVRVPTPFKL